MKTIFDLLFILNGTLGLVCFFLVCMSLRTNKHVNIYLAIILFAVSIRFILRGYLELSGNTELIMTLSHYDVFLLLTPLPYFYFKNVVSKKNAFKSKDLFHFFLPILVTIEINTHLVSSIFQVELNFATKLIIISTLIFYIITSSIFLAKIFWRKKSIIEIQVEQEALLKKWLIVLYFAFLMPAIKIFLDQLLTEDNQFLSENFITWLFWLIAFIFILASPSILDAYLFQISRKQGKETTPITFWRLKPINTITNPKDIRLSKKINGELNAYFVQITQFIAEKHLFRTSGVTINEFALISKIPISHLSFIFKYHSEISFLDYKKRSRILDAINLINEGYLKTNTLEGLSDKVGFKTYNSFYLGFKETTGQAPQNYINSLAE